jgi:hypothetical protein
MPPGFDATRRAFVETFMLGAAALAAQGQSGAEIPKRPLGRTGLEVSALGIGGYHLRSANGEAEATQIVNEALDAGVNFFDNAWEYHQGLTALCHEPPGCRDHQRCRFD